MSSTGSSADGTDEMHVFDDDLLPESGSTDESGSYLSSDSDSGFMEFGSTDSGSYLGSSSDSGYLVFSSGDDSESYWGSSSDSGFLEFGTGDSRSYLGSDSAYTESGSSDESLDSHSGSGYSNCTDISIGGDATYCIEGPICSGDGIKPTGYSCPQKHDVAIADCLKNIRSFLNGDCVAPRDSICHKTKIGIWGCAWDDEVPLADEEDASAATTPTTTEAPKSDDCTGVRVDGDATYCTTGTVCSGSGEKPAGASCPGSGDVAVGDCHDYLASYSSGKCVAPSDSVCQKLESGTWGCVWSSSTGDNGASFAIDTADVTKTTTDGGSSAALVGGIVAALVVAGVFVAVAVAWSRQKRQNQRRRSDITMDAVLTPQSSGRDASFQRV
ncbi:hypothetical protein KRP22_012272 [Phytophthora ramorum]|uniref:uncharacterized protein n=1 Tax=Phytophthora ramorum TaxID=164328 RepID=UPI0030A0CCB1|nr:hypothetical protein KRP23_3012 [Phytophthora ramorum]KAH7495366.1 hypothetical protein KRP22_14976 [Phytophthora ramorum]